MKDVQNHALIEPPAKRQKTGGRVKGSINKKNLMFAEELSAQDFNLAQERLWLYQRAKGQAQAIDETMLENAKLLAEYNILLDSWRDAIDAWQERWTDWVRDGKPGPEPVKPEKPPYPAILAVEDDRIALLQLCDSVSRDMMRYIYSPLKPTDAPSSADPLINSFSDMVKGIVHAELESSGKT